MLPEQLSKRCSVGKWRVFTSRHTILLLIAFFGMLLTLGKVVKYSSYHNKLKEFRQYNNERKKIIDFGL
jgi:hypothetical protein